MLKLRLISALILAPLVVLGVLKLDTTQFAVVVAVIMLIAAWEWSALAWLRTVWVRGAYVAATAVVLALVWQAAGSERLVNAVLAMALAWWMFALFWITRPDWGREPGVSHTLIKSLLGFGLFASVWLALVVLHSRADQGPVWVLFALMLVWVADSGAYFSGRSWGKNKLAPKVSPGKTWEGVYGALVASAVFAIGFGIWKGLEGWEKTSFVLVCMITVLFSIAGDLLESLLKRQRGIKDSGSIIPGHGGILDRIDSMLAAIPVFLIGMRWIAL